MQLFFKYKKRCWFKPKLNVTSHWCDRNKPKSVNALMMDWSPIHDRVFGRLGALRLHRTQPFVVGDSVRRCGILSFFCKELGPHVRRTCVLLSVGRSTADTIHTNNAVRQICQLTMTFVWPAYVSDSSKQQCIWLPQSPY